MHCVHFVGACSATGLTAVPRPRLQHLVGKLPPDEVVFTIDMGYNYLVFNGAVPYKGPHDARITKSYKARVNFCTMCVGVYDDNAKVVLSRLAWVCIVLSPAMCCRAAGERLVEIIVHRSPVVPLCLDHGTK